MLQVFNVRIVLKSTRGLFSKKIIPTKVPEVMKPYLPKSSSSASLPVSSEKADPDDEPSLFTSLMIFYCTQHAV